MSSADELRGLQSEYVKIARTTDELSDQLATLQTTYHDRPVVPLGQSSRAFSPSTAGCRHGMPVSLTGLPMLQAQSNLQHSRNDRRNRCQHCRLQRTPTLLSLTLLNWCLHSHLFLPFFFALRPRPRLRRLDAAMGGDKRAAVRPLDRASHSSTRVAVT